jgi:hemerythrin superfamily protein
MVQLLRDEHKHLKGLFTQFEAAKVRAPETCENVAKEIFMDLEIHSQIEEKFLYSEVEKTDASDFSDLQGLIKDSKNDHNEVKNLIQQLRSMKAANSEFQEKFKELEQSVLTHVETEENDLFPRVLELFDEQRLAKLESEAKSLRTELQKRPEYKDALPEQTQNPNGGEQIRKISAA